MRPNRESAGHVSPENFRLLSPFSDPIVASRSTGWRTFKMPSFSSSY
jgi:hypothetical protein